MKKIDVILIVSSLLTCVLSLIISVVALVITYYCR